MAFQHFDPTGAALLVLDHQVLLVNSYAKDLPAHLSKVANLLEHVRAAHVPVIYVTVGFRHGYPEVSENNMMFSGVKTGARFQLDDVRTSIPAEIAPKPSDSVVVKHRVSAFEGTDLAMLLRSNRIDTLVMFGIATSGVVLSTVRQAADLDYKLVLLHDLCLDNDANVHQFLIDFIFPRQVTLVTADEFVSLL
jgi:nicotinamidase-related amidase